MGGGGGPWGDGGSGGWFGGVGVRWRAAVGFMAGTAGRASGLPGEGPARPSEVCFVPSEGQAGLSWRTASRSSKNLLFVGIVLALFLPPTMTEFWQKVLVSEIGVYVLLAIGLNVVVGWAGGYTPGVRAGRGLR